MDYKTAMEFIHGRPRLRKAPSLERMKVFLKYLGNSQDSIKAVHVAGTNGKGSTSAFLAKMIQSAGYQVGTFTSPFITRFNERIAVNGEPIDDDVIIELIEKIRPVVTKMDQSDLGGPLEFEIVTAMMFLYFRQHPVDIVVIEVGIGGKYDPTNVFTPLVSIITNIGWDHMEMLGDTLPKIAEQKAGIIKPKIPVVTGTEDLDSLKVIEHTSIKNKSQLSIFKKDFGWDKNKFFSEGLNLTEVKGGLKGNYQKQNLAVALEAYRILSDKMGWVINKTQLKKAIGQTRWPGRMEIVSQKPVVVLDGAHNLPGIQALKSSIETMWSTQKIYILAAILEDKLFNKMLDELIDIKNAEVTLTTFIGPTKRKVVQSDELTQLEKSHVHYEKDWQIAYANMLEQVDENAVIIITGSLYFISEVRGKIIK